MKTKNKTAGGARPGSGRKKLPVSEKKIARSITLSPATWRKLDKIRGAENRSAFLEQKISRMK